MTRTLRTTTRFLDAGILLMLAVALLSSKAVAQNAQSKQTLLLEPQKNFSSSISYSSSLMVNEKSSHFAKEPQSSSSAVRGAMATNPSKSFGFLWDRKSGKLYIDVNGNGDLTDDPQGVYTNSLAQPGGMSEFLSAAPLPDSITGNTNSQFILLESSGNHTGLAGTSPVRSCVQSKITAGGQDWQIGVVEMNIPVGRSEPNRMLLLRPWSKHDETFDPTDSSLVCFAYVTKLSFNGTAWELKYGPRPGDKTKFHLELTEQNPQWAEISMPGKYVSRLILTPEAQAASYTVVVDRPEGKAKIPAGAYNYDYILEIKGGTLAKNWMDEALQKNTAVRLTNGAALDIGGPLTNSVSVSGSGSFLTLSYKLVGAGGCTYSYSRRNGDASAPKFVVTREGKEVGRGQFEYG